MFLKRKSVIALCVCLVLGQACRYKSESLTNVIVTHEVSPQPPRVGPLTITLKVVHASGRPATAARVNLEANMSHPGMTPVFAEAKETAPGRYLSTMELSMPGDWRIEAHMALPDGRKVEYYFEIKGVGQP